MQKWLNLNCEITCVEQSSWDLYEGLTGRLDAVQMWVHKSTGAKYQLILVKKDNEHETCATYLRLFVKVFDLSCCANFWNGLGFYSHFPESIDGNVQFVKQKFFYCWIQINTCRQIQLITLIRINQFIANMNIQQELQAMRDKSIISDSHRHLFWRNRFSTLGNVLEVLILLLIVGSTAVSFIAANSNSKTISFINGFIGLVTLGFKALSPAFKNLSKQRNQMLNKILEQNKVETVLDIVSPGIVDDSNLDSKGAQASADHGSVAIPKAVRLDELSIQVK